MNFQRLYIVLALGKNQHNLSYLDSAPESADKPVVVLLHGLIGFSGSFYDLLEFMPEQYRYIALDLNGFGFSDKSCPDSVSLYHQAVLVQEFFRILKLKNFILAGHATGATVALLSMADAEIRHNVSKLAVWDIPGISKNAPLQIKNLCSDAADNPLLRHTQANIASYVLLRSQFYNPVRITDAQINRLSEIISMPGSKEAIIAAGKAYVRPNQADFMRVLSAIECPVLIMWGEKDQIVDLADAFTLHSIMSNSKVRIIQNCGNAPHEEQPETTADLLSEFFNSQIEVFKAAKTVDERHIMPVATMAVPVSPLKAALKKAIPMPKIDGDKSKLHMSKLIDRWTVGTAFLLFFIKILQFLKFCGLRAKENGWRAATGVFLRNEYSKFVLGSFRLRYYNDYMKPKDTMEAKAQLQHRLSEFLSNQGDYYWAVEPGVMKLKRRKVFFIDIVEAEYDRDGKLLALHPFFDPRQNHFNTINPEQLELLLHRFVQEYNALLAKSDRVRTPELMLRLHFWASRTKQFSIPGKIELKILIDRLFTATFINFDYNCNTSLRDRLRTPDLRRRRHPGWGLLNIFCRFTDDLSEVDLWFQYHHVPVDGMPMQEILEKLKRQWGSAGEIVYPALTSPEARPEVIYCGDRIFRARLFVDFSLIMQVRKELNAKYATQMQGSVTVAGMIVWGMMRHEFFRNNKFLFPVDLAIPQEASQERELSMAFVRPNKFFDPLKPLESFILFQREFNRQIAATRSGRSESYELLELYSLMHPIFYYMARYLMPESTGEIVGTLGLSILKNAEMFVSPISDLQLKGFMAIGRINIPTQDGKTAAAVSVCARREYIKYYIRALAQMSQNYREFLNLPAADKSDAI